MKMDQKLATAWGSRQLSCILERKSQTVLSVTEKTEEYTVLRNLQYSWCPVLLEWEFSRVSEDDSCVTLPAAEVLPFRTYRSEKQENHKREQKLLFWPRCSDITMQWRDNSSSSKIAPLISPDESLIFVGIRLWEKGRKSWKERAR